MESRLSSKIRDPVKSLTDPFIRSADVGAESPKRTDDCGRDRARVWGSALVGEESTAERMRAMTIACSRIGTRYPDSR